MHYRAPLASSRLSRSCRILTIAQLFVISKSLRGQRRPRTSSSRDLGIYWVGRSRVAIGSPILGARHGSTDYRSMPGSGVSLPIKIVEGAQSGSDGGAKANYPSINRATEQGNVAAVIDQDVGMSPCRRTARVRCIVIGRILPDVTVHGSFDRSFARRVHCLSKRFKFKRETGRGNTVA